MIQHFPFQIAENIVVMIGGVRFDQRLDMSKQVSVDHVDIQIQKTHQCVDCAETDLTNAYIDHIFNMLRDILRCPCGDCNGEVVIRMGIPQRKVKGRHIDVAHIQIGKSGNQLLRGIGSVVNDEHIGIFRNGEDLFQTSLRKTALQCIDCCIITDMMPEVFEWYFMLH